MDISNIIEEKVVFLNQNFESTDELFEFIGSKTEELGFAKESYTQALKDREANFPTGLQLEDAGVAIPHSDPEHLKEEFVSLITLEKPTKFNSMEDPSKQVEVSVVFVLGLLKAEDQLASLQAIMQIIQDKEIIENLSQATNSEEAINILNKK